MIKIQSISNAHQWDGVELKEEDFKKLEEVLRFSKYTHTIKTQEADYPEPYLSKQAQAKRGG